MIPVGRTPDGRMSVGIIPVGTMSVGRMSVGRETGSPRSSAEGNRLLTRPSGSEMGSDVGRGMGREVGIEMGRPGSDVVGAAAEEDEEPPMPGMLIGRLVGRPGMEMGSPESDDDDDDEPPIPGMEIGIGRLVGRPGMEIGKVVGRPGMEMGIVGRIAFVTGWQPSATIPPATRNKLHSSEPFHVIYWI